MLSNIHGDENKNFYVRLLLLILMIIIIIWVIQPPKNKALQIEFWGHKIKSKIMTMNGSIGNNVYLIHRNNAAYIVNLYHKTSPKIAIADTEMNLAFDKLPKSASENEYKRLIGDRAYIRFYKGDYLGAINDFENASSLDFNDYLLLSMLYKKTAQYEKGLDICQKILNKDDRSYEGFACVATIESALGNNERAVNVMTFAIEQKKNNPLAYIERARYRKITGDIAGYNQDIEKAKALKSTVKTNFNYAESILNPETLSMPIRHF